MGTKKQGNHNYRQGKAARRGKSLRRGERKESLDLSLTPHTLGYLDRMARYAQISVSEVLEDWVAGMVELGAPLRPLGKGSRRAGTKAMRGQPIHYNERKTRLHLTVTPTTKRELRRMANNAHDDGEKSSMSDIVERWVNSATEYIDLMEAIEAREQASPEMT
jgi:hypothetical protein